MSDLAYQVHGPRDGPVVVLLHGFPLDRRMWRMQVGPLSAAGLRLVVPDLPGWGQSEGKAASMEEFSRPVLQLLDKLKVDKATFSGFSMGGYVALALAALAPARTDGLILIDTRANADAPEDRIRREAAMADVEAHGSRGLAMKQIETQLTAATRANQRVLVEEVRELLLSQSKEAVIAGLQAMRDRPDRLALLAQLDVPALILVGSEDKVTPLSAAQAMASAMKRATVQVIVASAHLTPMERPHEVNEAIIDWMRSP